MPSERKNVQVTIFSAAIYPVPSAFAVQAALLRSMTMPALPERPDQPDRSDLARRGVAAPARLHTTARHFPTRPRAEGRAGQSRSGSQCAFGIATRPAVCVNFAWVAGWRTQGLQGTGRERPPCQAPVMLPLPCLLRRCPLRVSAQHGGRLRSCAVQQLRRGTGGSALLFRSRAQVHRRAQCGPQRVKEPRPQHAPQPVGSECVEVALPCRRTAVSSVDVHGQRILACSLSVPGHISVWSSCYTAGCSNIGGRTRGVRGYGCGAPRARYGEYRAAH
jgi:hypothetical protein